MNIQKAREKLKKEKAEKAKARAIKNKYDYKRKKRSQTIGKKNINDFFVRGIYFLYKNGEIVYVGMSETNVMTRITRHFDDADKDFDHFSIQAHPKMSRRQLLGKEKALIRRYNPKYNIVHNQDKNNINYI